MRRIRYAFLSLSFAPYEAHLSAAPLCRIWLAGADYYQTSSALVLNGPTKIKFTRQDNVDIEVWSPCSGDALFNIDASVAVTPLSGSANGVLGIARESGRLGSDLYVKWKKC